MPLNTLIHKQLSCYVQKLFVMEYQKSISDINNNSKQYNIKTSDYRAVQKEDEE